MTEKDFKKKVLDFYQQHGRHALPWRKKVTPYYIVVSEMMLQQTQVDRVMPFFKNWMRAFPNFKALANAQQTDVLRLWKGLGYNNRALRLQKLAQTVMEKYKGRLPQDHALLEKLPGIGPYTAGAVLAFAYNIFTPFIETNIRRVYIHHFFHNKKEISDNEILKKVLRTSDHEKPRIWYWALMDYGSYLAKTIPNPNKKSKHYSKQSKFEGSDRQIRGRILDILLGSKKTSRISLVELQKLVNKNLTCDQKRLKKIVNGLQKEEFLLTQDNTVFLV